MSEKVDRRVGARRKGERRQTKGKRPHSLPDRRTRPERRRLRGGRPSTAPGLGGLGRSERGGEVGDVGGARDDRVEEALLAAGGDAKVAIVSLLAGIDADAAGERLARAGGVVRKALES